MAKFNLSDAAKNVLLGEDSKSYFDANIAQKRSQRELTNPEKVGSSKLSTSIVPGQKDVGMIGQSPERALTDELPDYLKGTPGQATPPGATPPVGAQQDGVGASKATGPQDTMGRKDIMNPAKSDATDYESIRDRIAGKLAPQMMQTNPGGVGIQSYGEESEYDDESLTEEEKMKMKKMKMEDEMMHDNMKNKKMMQNKMKMKEDIDALLSGENLSEEFVQRATTIFEAAVLSRVDVIAEEIEAELTEQFEIAVEQIKEDLASKVDNYLNYMVEEWMTENQLAIESGLRAEITEDFISGLRDLFVEHYIDIPAEKVDVVEELAAKVEELESALNEEISNNVELKRELNEQIKIEAIYAVCEGLTQTQVEKMKSLAENVEFTTEEEFAEKLATLRDSYFKADVKVANKLDLTEGIDVEEEVKKSVSTDPSMDIYAKTISQTLIK
jgi:hypothetical protein